MTQTRTITATITTDNRKASGYAIVFNSPAKVYGERSKPFTEIVRPGSVKLAPDLRLLWNHDTSNVLGNAAKGTLSVRQDEKGVYFEAEMPESAIREREAIVRGDVDGMSFRFATNKDKYDRATNTVELLDIYVDEISFTAFPVYKATSAGIRCRNRMRMDLAEKELAA